MAKVLYIALLASLFLSGSSTNLKKGDRTCALLVIVDGGRNLPSPEQLDHLERRIRPLLAERGLVLSRDKSNAAMLARVEFESDANDPRVGDITIRVIEPNPTRGIPAPATDPADSLHRAQQDSFRRMEQQLYDEGRKPHT